VSRSRRQQIVRVEERDAEPKGFVEDFMARNEESIEAAMPILGAAGGALLLEVLSQRVPMRKDALAAFGAGIAFVTATNLKGSARQLAMGAAAAGACFAVVETLRHRRPKAIYGEPKPVELPQRQAAPAGVSREEFQRVIDDQTKQREDYESRIAELQATIHGLLQQLRNASAERIVERNAAEPSPIVEPPAEAPVAAEPDAATVASEPPDEATAKLQAVYSQLTDDEIERLREILTGMPPMLLARAQERLLSISTEEAVEYLRENVLARSAA
jgi:hypothetical protein